VAIAGSGFDRAFTGVTGVGFGFDRTFRADLRWAKDMSVETLARAMAHSVCFGVLRRGELVGFARVVIDRATFA
jgi:hypothetical protein